MGLSRQFGALHTATVPIHAFVAVSLLAACGPGSASAENSALADALETLPGIAPRLSMASAFRPCTEQPPAGGTVARAECPPRSSSRTSPAAITRALPAGDDPAAVQARAIVDIVVPDERGKALDRAITALRRLEGIADRPAPVLADLSAALIVRAERTQAPRDLLEAYETAEQALQRDPRNRAALYNRALALDRFGLVDETVRDWRAYLAADSTSGWADNARRRIRALLALRPPPRPADDAPLSAYTAYAAADPQGARELGMDRLLAEWGAAVEAGDAARAADRLARAAALGEALERRPGGDASLADMVRAIRAAGRAPATLRDLAAAHREFSAAMALYASVAYAQAEARLSAVAATTSPVLRDWARVYWGTARVYNRRTHDGEQILRGVIAAADPARHPALAGRARWSLGNTLGRMDRWEEALAHAREAARLFSGARERENESGALNVATDAHAVLGEPDSSFATMHRAIAQLLPYQASVRRHTTLTAGARFLERDGLLGAALSLQNESVSVATRNMGPIQIIEARAARARLLAASGQANLAADDVAKALPILTAVQDTAVRRWLRTDLREVEALASLASNPGHATTMFDSAAAFFAGIPFRALPYLVSGAEARLAAGDPSGATTRLLRVLSVLDRRRDSMRMEPRRAAVFEGARTVIERIVMLTLAKGRVAEALDYLDKGRVSLAAAGGSLPHRAEVSGPPGEVVVAYALVADTLLAWTVSGHQVQIFRAAVDTTRLVRTIHELEAKLQQQSAPEEVRPALSLLYDWLLRPLEGRLGLPGTPLVLIVDGVLAPVPFAALYDARRGRYLIERQPLRFATSLREASRPRAQSIAPGAVLVANPAFSAREHPLLDQLPHAIQEVRAFSNGYAGATVLESHRASRRAFVSALARSGVAHFAGHAVFDDERPERSYLVLAPEGNASGRIAAEELARLDLRHVRVVVLAACRTIRAGRARAAGFTGLSGALLAAGAGGTVGSIWDVDDRATAVLMAEFHRQYQRSRDGPRSLHQAQVALLRSENVALRSPAAWAGFRYAGH